MTRRVVGEDSPSVRLDDSDSARKKGYEIHQRGTMALSAAIKHKIAEAVELTSLRSVDFVP